MDHRRDVLRLCLSTHMGMRVPSTLMNRRRDVLRLFQCTRLHGKQASHLVLHLELGRSGVPACLFASTRADVAG